MARARQPPFDRSALDGYALRAADIAAAGPVDALVGASGAAACVQVGV